MKRFLPPLVTFFVLLVSWHLLASTGWVSSLILPMPGVVVQTLMQNVPLFAYHTWITTAESLGGFLIGLVAALVVGLLTVVFPLFERAMTPWVIAGQSFPKEALSPLLAVWLGYSMEPKVLLAGMICFFPLAIAFSRGLLSTDRDTVDMLKMLGSSRKQELRYYRLPNSIPSLLTGIRIALPLSLIGAVVGEFAGSSAGLGHLIRVNKGHLESGFVFGCLVALALLGIVYYLVVLLLEWPLRRYLGDFSTIAY